MNLSKKLTLIALFFLFGITKSMAQSETPDYKHIFDVALSGGNNFTTAFSWASLYPITKNKKFRIGYGVRLNSIFMNGNKDFVTAPAKLTSGVTNPSALFAENILANFDTLSLKNGQVNSLNATIHLQYNITPKLEIGFNIDAIGFSFGASKSATFQSSIFQNGQVTQQNAKPTSFNLLLISDNDLGSLNSEIYARYWWADKWAVKAGGTFIFTEYTTNKKLSLDNDRFRDKSFLLMLGITYRLLKN